MSQPTSPAVASTWTTLTPAFPLDETPIPRGLTRLYVLATGRSNNVLATSIDAWTGLNSIANLFVPDHSFSHITTPSHIPISPELWSRIKKAGNSFLLHYNNPMYLERAAKDPPEFFATPDFAPWPSDEWFPVYVEARINCVVHVFRVFVLPATSVDLLRQTVLSKGLWNLGISEQEWRNWENGRLWKGEKRLDDGLDVCVQGVVRAMFLEFRADGIRRVSGVSARKTSESWEEISLEGRMSTRTNSTPRDRCIGPVCFREGHGIYIKSSAEKKK